MPEFTNLGSKYSFSWPEYQLAAEVSRIVQNHETIKCQLLFTTTDKDNNPHLLQTRFNLESSRARSELAKDMTNRYTVAGQIIDWKSILEYISIKSIRESEQGEPIIKISSLDDIIPLEYLISPIIPANKPTVLFGDPGSGKSQLMVIFGIMLALNWHDNPLRLNVTSKKVVPLLLDYEADENDIRRQVASLTNGMELGYSEINYRRCSIPLASEIEAIRNHIEKINANVLFIDSVSLAAGGDLNAMNVATSYFTALRQLKGITSVSLAHTSKDKENKNKTILGSVLFEAGARSIWEVRGQGEDDLLDIALFHQKANLSQKSPPLGYRINYLNDTTTTIEWHDPKSVDEFVQRMAHTQRILIYLKDGGKTHKEMCDELGISSSTLYVTTTRLKKSGSITKIGEKWVLASRFETNEG